MSIFDNRDIAFQGKYARDAENQFRAKARRARLLGHWAAKLLDKTGDDAADYARDVVYAHLNDAVGTTVFNKLSVDLKGVLDDAEIKAKISDYMKESRKRPRATD
ncbi:MAG: DUF1476 domain-containing protein [Pseudomonadota bacterium]